MIIKENDILTLDNNKKYIVISSINYKNKKYYYLLDVDDNKNAMICYEENNELIKIDNEKNDKKFIDLLVKQMKLITKQIM